MIAAGFCEYDSGFSFYLYNHERIEQAADNRLSSRVVEETFVQTKRKLVQYL
jgi:hypothetical protein